MKNSNTQLQKSYSPPEGPEQQNTPIKKSNVPIINTIAITNSYPSKPSMVNGNSAGGSGAGAGQLASQSTQEQAGVLSCKNNLR